MIFNLLEIDDIDINNNLYSFSIKTEEGLTVWFDNIKLLYISDNKFEFKTNKEFVNKYDGTFTKFILEGNNIKYISTFYFDPISGKGKYCEGFDFQYSNKKIKQFFDNIKMSYNRYPRNSRHCN